MFRIPSGKSNQFCAARHTAPIAARNLRRLRRRPSLSAMASARQTRGKARGARREQAPHGAFGARLAALRASAALTQVGLAGRLGVSRRQIAYYESGHGRPPGALLGRIADLFRVSTDAV